MRIAEHLDQYSSAGARRLPWTSAPEVLFGLGQWRTDNDVNQYSYGTAIEEAGLRPPFFPTDTTPMEVVTCDPNPGEAELLKEGEILPLQPVGARSVLVYPGVVPAPDITTDMSYEDRYPRGRRDILRGRSHESYYGPWPPPYGIEQTMDGFGETMYAPLYFPQNPEDVAYQTYPGPTLGQADKETAASRSRLYSYILATSLGGTVAVLALTYMKQSVFRDVLGATGVVAGGIGLSNLISEIVGIVRA